VPTDAIGPSAIAAYFQRVDGNAKISIDSIYVGPTQDDLLLAYERGLDKNALALDTTYGVRAVTNTASMLFVDLMRLLYVASSDLARNANAERYHEFVDLAEQHLADFKSRKASFVTLFDQRFKEQLDSLEMRLSWMLGRLRIIVRDHGPRVGTNRNHYYATMMKVADQLDELCSLAAIPDYDRIVESVCNNIEVLVRTPGAVEAKSLDSLWRLRLSVQSILLKGRSVRSIVEDMDHDFAVTYFAVDRQLLRHLTNRQDRDWLVSHAHAIFIRASQQDDLRDENVTKDELIALLIELIEKGHIILFTAVRSDHHPDDDSGFNSHEDGFCADVWPLNSTDPTDYANANEPKMIQFLSDAAGSRWLSQIGLPRGGASASDASAAGRRAFSDDRADHIHLGTKRL
jgi:hypothetical protein